MDYEKHILSLDQMLADLTIENKRLKILLSKVKTEFDNGGVTWETRDEIENIFR
jgi:hypothetical protein